MTEHYVCLSCGSLKIAEGRYSEYGPIIDLKCMDCNNIMSYNTMMQYLIQKRKEYIDSYSKQIETM